MFGDPSQRHAISPKIMVVDLCAAFAALILAAQLATALLRDNTKRKPNS